MAGEDHDLPLPDYDGLQPGDLEDRVRTLSRQELEQLLTYEREHADRRQVVELLRFRLRQVEAGARPASGGLGGASVAPPPQGTSPVTPDTAAPPIHPPPHGTPQQPGRPKGDRP
ncbi:hypothetical protein ACXZ65_35135 [Streptomyces aculeolatus]